VRRVAFGRRDTGEENRELREKRGVFCGRGAFMVKWGRLFTRVTMPAPKLSQSQGSDGSNTSATVFGWLIHVDYVSLGGLSLSVNSLFLARRFFL
jgi:hypothetical protein